MTLMLQSTLLAVALLCGSPALAQGTTLYRCTVKGKTTFQQQPCPANSSAEEMRVVPSNTEQSLPPLNPASAAVPPPEPQAPQAPQAATVKSALEQEADQCLDHIRSFLRDPRSAYASAPSREGRVLSLTVYAANVRGGVSAKRAACELFNGVVDAAWTKIHLERLGWFSRRMLVNRDGRRVLVPDYDDIEARPQ
jgi:type IV secretory pathway VirB10-like protein